MSNGVSKRTREAVMVYLRVHKVGTGEAITKYVNDNRLMQMSDDEFYEFARRAIASAPAAN